MTFWNSDKLCMTHALCDNEQFQGKIILCSCPHSHTYGEGREASWILLWLGMKPGFTSWILQHLIPELSVIAMVMPDFLKTKDSNIDFTHKYEIFSFWEQEMYSPWWFMPPEDKTITANTYCEILRCLQWAIVNRRRGMLTRGVCLFYNSAWPYIPHVSSELLDSWKWDV